jgi:transposase-like protein
MAEQYDFATRDLCRQCYIYRGQTYEEIAEKTGVSPSQLKRWGKDEHWKEQRDEYVNSKSNNLTRLMNVRENILKTLEAEVNPNTVHQLLGGYRQASSIIDAQLTPGGGEVDRPAIFLQDLRFIAEELARIDPKGLAVIDKNFDALIEAFKESHP